MSVPKSIYDASPDFLRMIADRLRRQGFVALMDMSIEDPDGVSGKDHRVESYVVPDMMHLVVEAFEMVANHFDKNDEMEKL